MKKIINIIVLSFIVSSFNPIQHRLSVQNIKTSKLPITPIPNGFEMDIIKPKNLFMFLYSLGYRESSNNYLIENKYGYLGKYQFGRATLRGLGYNITSTHFLNNPNIQEEAMLKLLRHNKSKLQKHINKHEGQLINNIFITESGILAAAHLGGVRNVKRWFRGAKFRDGFGTSLSDYMDEFSGYDMKYLVWNN